MSRQPQRVHKKFYQLKLRANFFIGKSTYEKTTFCTARLLDGSIAAPGTRINLFIAPWRVVRSDEFVNKRITVNKSAESCRLMPDNAALGYDAHIHRVTNDNVAVGQIQQPNSDNNITGPTS